jgi:hypothetical protein
MAHRKRMAPLIAALLVPGAALAGSVASPNFNVPNKDVVLRCAPLPYEIHCSISRLANPEYSSFCFYVGDDRSSYPMKRDYRFGFYNGIVTIKVTNGMQISADLVEDRTGAHARCREWHPSE